MTVRELKNILDSVTTDLIGIDNANSVEVRDNGEVIVSISMSADKRSLVEIKKTIQDNALDDALAYVKLNGKGSPLTGIATIRNVNENRVFYTHYLIGA